MGVRLGKNQRNPMNSRFFQVSDIGIENLDGQARQDQSFRNQQLRR